MVGKNALARRQGAHFGVSLARQSSNKRLGSLARQCGQAAETRVTLQTSYKDLRTHVDESSWTQRVGRTRLG